MSCEGCKLGWYLCTAQEIVEDHTPDTFSPTLKERKVAQLATAEAIYEKLSRDCHGLIENVSCGIAEDLNKIMELVFSDPQSRIDIAANSVTALNKS